MKRIWLNLKSFNEAAKRAKAEGDLEHYNHIRALRREELKAEIRRSKARRRYAGKKAAEVSR